MADSDYCMLPREAQARGARRPKYPIFRASPQQDVLPLNPRSLLWTSWTSLGGFPTPTGAVHTAVRGITFTGGHLSRTSKMSSDALGKARPVPFDMLALGTMPRVDLSLTWNLVGASVRNVWHGACL